MDGSVLYLCILCIDSHFVLVHMESLLFLRTQPRQLNQSDDTFRPLRVYRNITLPGECLGELAIKYFVGDGLDIRTYVTSKFAIVCCGYYTRLLFGFDAKSVVTRFHARFQLVFLAVEVELLGNQSRSV